MKLKDMINKYRGSSILDPDHILWNYLKEVLNNTKYCSNIVNIVKYMYQFQLLANSLQGIVVYHHS